MTDFTTKSAFAKYIFLISIALLIVPGCALPGFLSSGKDTCTQGENMTNPRLVAGIEETKTGQKIRITWDTGTEKGAKLPVEYYQAVTIEDESNVAKSIALTAEREITVEFADLATYLQNENLVELKLLFPDRREVISCHHAGMNDVYFLKLTLAFASDGSLQDVTFDQGIWLGPI